MTVVVHILTDCCPFRCDDDMKGYIIACMSLSVQSICVCVRPSKDLFVHGSHVHLSSICIHLSGFPCISPSIHLLIIIDLSIYHLCPHTNISVQIHLSTSTSSVDNRSFSIRLHLSTRIWTYLRLCNPLIYGSVYFYFISIFPLLFCQHLSIYLPTYLSIYLSIYLSDPIRSDPIRSDLVWSDLSDLSYLSYLWCSSYLSDLSNLSNLFTKSI